MELTKHEYEQILFVVEELAVKQMIMDLEQYRREVLNVFSNILGYSQSLFWVTDENQKLANPVTFNVDMQALHDYQQYFYQFDYLQPENLKRKSSVQSIKSVVPFAQYLTTDYYHLFMKKNRLLDQMAIYLEYQGELIGVIGLVRNADEETFNPRDFIKLNFLVKQVESGFNMQRLLTANRSDPSLLTEREREIVDLLVRGLKNIEIAEQLYISENTVKKHLQNLYRKFDTSSRTELLFRLRGM
ncbi:hypothetical protein BTR22_04370 [Alkalihalophilus pseudofirmus]|uniref:response regulator transcription factor n=1 Tax=Alkalihalophilus pseudofirmus TaxID=79885 RepID=UPI00095322B7|nr:hypothetical protein BTR22_04370 [Alkalihalophilus pseudofirmus]